MSKEHYKINAGIFMAISCDEKKANSLRLRISKIFELNPLYDTLGLRALLAGMVVRIYNFWNAILNRCIFINFSNGIIQSNKILVA